MVAHLHGADAPGLAAPELAHQQGQIASDKAEMDALIAAGARVRT